MKYWLTSLLLTLSFNLLAEGSIIYRWVDSNGVVHFSQNQPATGKYTEIVMANSSIPNLNKSETPEPVLPNKTTLDKKTAKEVAFDSSKQCADAQQNLKTLVGFERVRLVNENGDTQILNKAEQEEQIAINKKIIDIYCKPSSAKK